MKLQNSVSFTAALALLALPSETVSGFRAIFQRRRHASSNNNNNKPPATARKTNFDYEVVAAPDATQATAAAADGLEYMSPDVLELFDRIRHVSPLAKMAIENEQRNLMNGSSGFHSVVNIHRLEPRGFDALPQVDDLPWKSVENSRRGVVSHVDRIDNFNGVDAPLLRFRATLDGPCVADPLASLIMDLEERSKWDVQIHDVFEAHNVQDLPSANAAMGFAYGNCYRLGVGYCRTKKNLGIDAREQLTLCGINTFLDGSSMIWGVELPERHNDLMPSHYDRVTRAKSHLFSTTLVPTSESSFDVEYVLQLEIGGKIPAWLTTPIVTDSVKRLFKCAKDVYANHREYEKSSRSAETLLLSP